MAHPKIHEIYPLETVVRIKKTGKFAIIKDHTFLKEWLFLHYLGEIEGRQGWYYLAHDDIDLEALPKPPPNPLAYNNAGFAFHIRRVLKRFPPSKGKK